MKRLIIAAVLFAFVATASAFPVTKSRKSLVEFGPKASMYTGPFRLGLGAEVLFNPVQNLSIRMDLFELSFIEYTQFYLNYGSSIDGLIYIPARGLNPYFFAGLGIASISNDESVTSFVFRFGLGVEHRWDRRTNLFIEPGLIIADVGAADTDVIFRLSLGARLRLLR